MRNLYGRPVAVQGQRRSGKAQVASNVLVAL